MEKKTEQLSPVEKQDGHDFEFYKKFYDDNRVKLLQYNNLRDQFKRMITIILGPDYYNMAMDVYDCDRICCDDIVRKFKNRIYFYNIKTLFSE